MPIVSLGPTPTRVDGAQAYPLGTRGIDNVGNEFIYMKGVASTVIYDLVKFDEDFVTTRIVPDSVGPVAVASGAIDATTKWGWFCVKGIFPVNSDTVAADKLLFIDTGAGRVDDVTVAGDTVLGMFSMTTDTYSGVANITKAYLNYPFVTDNAGLST